MGDTNGQRVPYICGPLPEHFMQTSGISFYEALADVCQQVLGDRAFLPHEHYPIEHRDFTPENIYIAVRKQICTLTSMFVVVPIAPSWDCGMEVEMARQSGVPVIILAERAKLDAGKISRLLRGSPAVGAVIVYEDAQHALYQLDAHLQDMRRRGRI